MGQGNGYDWAVFSRSVQHVLPLLGEDVNPLCLHAKSAFGCNQHGAMLKYMQPASQQGLRPCLALRYRASISIKADASVLFCRVSNLCQIGFLDTALHGLLTCCICVCLSDFCIWIEHWKKNFMIWSLSDKFECHFSMSRGKNGVLSCQMKLVLFSIFVIFFSVLLYLAEVYPLLWLMDPCNRDSWVNLKEQQQLVSLSIFNWKLGILVWQEQLSIQIWQYTGKVKLYGLLI